MEVLYTPSTAPQVGIDVWSNEQAFALVPHPRGEAVPLPMVVYSADGVRFEAGQLDLSPIAAASFGDLPGRGSLRVLSGRFFYKHGPQFVEGRIGASIALRPLYWRMPQPNKFVVQTIVAHPDGSLWLGGHQSVDSAKGAVFYSRDEGQTWVAVPEKIPGSVNVLIPHERHVLALAYRSVMRVGDEGAEEIAKYKDEVRDVHVDARGVFGFGDTFTAYTAPGKRPKYGKLLDDSHRGSSNRVAAGLGQFVLAKVGRTEVWTSEDALAWTPVPNDRLVRAVVPSAGGVRVVSTTGDVLAPA